MTDSNAHRVRAIILALDDVIFDPETYLERAHATITDHLARRYGRPTGALRTALANVRRRFTRTDAQLLVQFLKETGLPPGELPDLTELLEHHRIDTLEPHADAAQLLGKRSHGCRIALIDDGPGRMQRTKIDALGIIDQLDYVVLTRDHGRVWAKPSPLPYLSVLKELDVEPGETLSVGVDPRTDFGAPRSLGMPSVRLRRGELAALDLPAWLGPVPEITTLADLPVCLRAA